MAKREQSWSVTHEFLRLSRSTALVAGIALLWSVNYATLVGSLTGQGSMVFHWLGTEEPTLTQGPLHAAAFTEGVPSGGTELLFGILLILLGFLLHALLTIQRERPVHITVQKTQKKNVWNVRYREWFWIELWS